MPDEHYRLVHRLDEGTGVTFGTKIIISWTTHKRTTFVHELGHRIIGPEHHDDEKNIMYAEPDPGSSHELDLGQAREYSGQ